MRQRHQMMNIRRFANLCRGRPACYERHTRIWSLARPGHRAHRDHRGRRLDFLCSVRSVRSVAQSGSWCAGHIGLSQLLTLLLIFLIIGSLSLQTLGQKRSDRGAGDNKPETTSPAGPKRTDRSIPESERVKVITKTEFVKVAVRANKGYLSVLAIPTAIVTLTPLPANRKNAPAIRETVKDEDGSLNLINLLPGNYKIVIEHPDYDPY